MNDPRLNIGLNTFLGAYVGLAAILIGRGVLERGELQMMLAPGDDPAGDPETRREFQAIIAALDTIELAPPKSGQTLK